MTAEEIRKIISDGFTLFSFNYHSVGGGVDPFYTPEDGHSYSVFYGYSEKTVYSVDDVMSMPFFDGKSLSKIADDITDIEW